jgi:hypothetical protein
MKKLSTNEAYAYLQRDKIAVKTSTVQEQGPSDEDELLGPLETIQKIITRTVTHRTTSWRVTNSTAETYEEWSRQQKRQAERGKRILQDQLIKQYKKSLKLWNVNELPYTDTLVQDAERDDKNILYRAYEEKYLDNQDPNDTIEAPGVNFDLYKYKTQLSVDVSTEDDDDEILMYFKPVWPTDMTLEIMRNHQYQLKKDSKIYATFDDQTILCFAYQEGVVKRIAKSLLSENDSKHEPRPGGAVSGRRITFDPSLKTTPLPDSDNVDL